MEKKETIVRFEQYNHLPLVMRLKKQRYTCKNCRTHWTAQVILSNPDIQSQIMLDIKLLLY